MTIFANCWLRFFASFCVIFLAKKNWKQTNIKPSQNNFWLTLCSMVQGGQVWPQTRYDVGRRIEIILKHLSYKWLLSCERKTPNVQAKVFLSLVWWPRSIQWLPKKKQFAKYLVLLTAIVSVQCARPQNNAYLCCVHWQFGLFYT